MIQTELAGSNSTLPFHEYRNQTIELPVIRLPIEYPIYRVENYRTRLHQLKHARDHNLTLEYFRVGEENEEIQRLQHSYLVELSHQDSESIASIVEALKEDGQRDPLLITRAGVVVNGNRRLAAMRELYAHDGVTHANFSHVNCLVLPAAANEDDLKDVEVRLQMTPETRLPYGWVNECMAIQDLHQRGRDFGIIARNMRKTQNYVRERLQSFAEVDLYLNDWQRSPGNYDLVENAEEMFSQVSRRLQRKDGTEREIARKFGWILLDQRGIDGRVYDLREATGTLTVDVIRRIQERYEEELQIDGDNDADAENELEFSGVEASPEILVDTFLESARGNSDLQEEIVAIIRSSVEASRSQRVGSAAQRSIRDAYTKLMEADLGTADAETLEPIERLFDSIETRLSQMRRLLEARKQAQ